MNQLGRFEKVELRDFWKTEAGDFTPWFAWEENIALLGDGISTDLEVETQGKQVGPLRADILCNDTAFASMAGLLQIFDAAERIKSQSYQLIWNQLCQVSDVLPWYTTREVWFSSVDIKADPQIVSPDELLLRYLHRK